MQCGTAAAAMHLPAPAVLTAAASCNLAGADL
jgi:hypothetical protein